MNIIYIYEYIYIVVLRAITLVLVHLFNIQSLIKLDFNNIHNSIYN